MTFPIFRGDGTRQKDLPVPIPRSTRPDFTDPEGYRADPGLVDAVNVAIMLGQPLLLTGEPGTGKTQLAYYLAWELGDLQTHKFETKSTSTATDIFYTYDAIRRFQDAQSQDVPARPTQHYISYNALGRAILYSHNVNDLIGDDNEARKPVSWYFADPKKHPGKQRSVVLIDEIDKAPRDVPNDLLNEIDRMYFRVPELDNRQLSANPGLLPIVILTSNSEKDLPPAFLRRCVFYNIPFPKKERMTALLLERMGKLKEKGINRVFFDTAVDVFYRMRDKGFRKEPATAELLDWVAALHNMAPGLKNPLLEQPELAQKTLSSLIKNTADTRDATEILKSWQESLKKR